MISFKKIFVMIYLPIVLALLCFFYLEYMMTARNMKAILHDTMKEKWSLITYYNMDAPDSKMLHDIIARAGKESPLRITVITPEGTVLNDSSVAYDEIKNMQNHKARDEIRSALLGEDAFSVRKSPTTSNYMLYYAKMMPDGNVLRLSYNAQHIEAIEKAMRLQLAGLSALLLLITGAIAIFLARKFSEPIKKLDTLADVVATSGSDFHFPEFKDATMNKISAVMYKIHTNLMREKIAAVREREKLDIIFSTMNEGIILLDAHANVIHFNRKSEELLGIEFSNIKNIIADSSDVETIVLFKELTEKDMQEQRRIRFKDRIFDVYSRKSNDQTLIVFSEVTEKAQYEAFKTELVGNITHELKTPLSLIMGASETILSDKSMDETVRNKFLETINRNSKKLNEIVNETLDLHREESQKGFQTVDAPSNLRDTAEDIKLLLAPMKNGKEIIYDIPDIGVGVRQEHIASIFSNLITNALKYSHGTKIYVGAEKKDNRVKISVADEGPAIQDSEQKRIFERFYTVSKSRARSNSGSGLGLAIVKHIANQYSGKASVRTNIYGGNTFEVTLREKSVKPNEE